MFELKKKKRKHFHTAGGKIFQGNTPVVPASRKALGDVKQNLALSVNGQGTRLTQKPQGLCPQQQLFKKPLQPRETPQSVKRPKIQVKCNAYII